MAIDDATSAGKPATPSLLAGRTSLDERDSKSSRILANLEGRAAEPERQHLPIEQKRSRRGLLFLLLLLLVGAGAGLAYWRSAQRGSVAVVALDDSKASAAAASGASPGNANLASGVASGASNSATGSASAPAAVVTPGSPSASTAAPSAPSAAASITDAQPATSPRADDAAPASNPLSALASAAPAASAAASQGVKNGAPVNEPSGAATKGKATTKTAHTTSKSKKKPDNDAALLSALFAYGLPVPSKTDNAATLPGTPLAERLQMCRRKPFLESEQCRLQVCAGQWGIAPECPNPQAQTHN